jgi:hypothetical protein
MPVGIAVARAVGAHTVATALHLPSVLLDRVDTPGASLPAAIHVTVASEAHALVVHDDAVAIAVQVAAVVALESLVAAALAILP